MTTRLLFVEDHSIIVDGLRAAFRDRPEVTVVGHAATLAEGRELVESVACDVVLLDLRLPDGLGIELLREARVREDAPWFLILSSFVSPEYVSAAVALGASGFLLKTAPAAEILAAIQVIADGGLAFSAEQLRVSRNVSWAPLTSREHAVLAGIMRGRSNDELASDIGIAKKTVEAYIARLFARYDVVTRTELALYAERHQLLDLPVRPPRGS